MVLILVSSLSGVAFAQTSSTAATTTAAVPPGIKAQFNGQEIRFADAAPKIINGRTMVPFRQILETMGATVTFDPQTQTVTVVKPGIEFSFVIGKTDITVVQNGSSTIKKMDVAPFLDPKTNRTYVPARFMAESMGNSVFWDQEAQTAVIIDQNTIFADADKDFSIISKLLTMDMDLQKSYESTGTFQANFAVSEKATGSESMAFAMNGDFSGITKQSSADMEMNMAFDADQLTAMMTAEEKVQMQPMLDMLRDIQMRIKMNGTSGALYMNSNIFSLMDPSIGQNTWLKMNVFDTYDEMGMDIRPLMNYSGSRISFSELLEACVMSMNSGTVDSYQEMKLAYAFMKNLMGDQAFTAVVSGSDSIYTLKLDKMDILAAMAEAAMNEGVQLDSAVMSEMNDAFRAMALNADITIKETNGKLASYEMTGALSAEGIDCTFSQIGGPRSATMNMTMGQQDMMTMTVSATSQYVETLKTPDLSLPAGAQILDYDSLT
jgi:hypothetical protein